MGSMDKYNSLFEKYLFGNREGSGYAIFESHKEWFREEFLSGRLKLYVKTHLEEILEHWDARKYDYSILLIQAIGLEFAPEDNHVELLFKIALNLLKQKEAPKSLDWMMYQLMDTSIHNGEEIEKFNQGNPSLAYQVLAEIGKQKYTPEESGPNMYYAAEKAIWLFQYLRPVESQKLLEEIYMKHFDGRVAEDAIEEYKGMKKKILFICTANKMRSATAHELYKDDKRFLVSSAGTDSEASNPINENILEWADSILVMEKHHRNFIRKKFPSIYNSKKIACMYIPDEYDFMDEDLIAILTDRFEDFYRRKLI